MGAGLEKQHFNSRTPDTVEEFVEWHFIPREIQKEATSLENAIGDKAGGQENETHCDNLERGSHDTFYQSSWRQKKLNFVVKAGEIEMQMHCL